MGRLLGDPEVWDDSPSRPRVLLRGLVGLAVGLAAGALVAFAVVPRPPAPPPDGRLAVLDSGVLTRVDRDGATHRIGPANFVADGLAGRGGRLLACADAAGRRRPAAGLLLSAGGGPSRPVRLGCPVAWAAGADVFAGAGGPWRRVARIERDAAVTRGASVLVGRPGARPRVLLGARALRAAAGAKATVEAVALSPDGELVAVAAGSPGRPWVVLVLRADGRQVARIPLADGHRPAWLGWSDRHGTVTLAVAAVDRRGDLGTVPLASRRGGGYVLAWEAAHRTSRVLVAGTPMVAADGFAWSSDGESIGVSSPAGLVVVLQIDVVYATAAPVTGTLVAWPAEAVP